MYERGAAEGGGSATAGIKAFMFHHQRCKERGTRYITDTAHYSNPQRDINPLGSPAINPLAALPRMQARADAVDVAVWRCGVMVGMHANAGTDRDLDQRGGLLRRRKELEQDRRSLVHSNRPLRVGAGIQLGVDRPRPQPGSPHALLIPGLSVHWAARVQGTPSLPPSLDRPWPHLP